MYASIGSGIFMSLITYLICQKVDISPIPFIASLFITIPIEIALICMDRNSSAYKKLNALTFYLYAFGIGGSIGILRTDMNPKELLLFHQICMSAFIMTTALFGTFSIFSIATSKRLGIYFGASILCLVIGIINIFIWNVMLEAMIGVVIGCLYVIIDTQTIIHKTENGIFDVYRDAKMLFVDFVKIFIHILKILSENKKEKKEKKK